MCGRVTAPWVAGRIKTAVKVVAEQLQSDAPSPLEFIWVYRLPESAGKDLPRVPPVINVQELDNSRSETIDPQVVARLMPPQPDGGAP